MQRSAQSGFTLIEIMIVAALIAILATIALPAYNNYITRSKLKTAHSDLVALSLNFENRYRKRLNYGTVSYANTSALQAESDFAGWSPASKAFVFSSVADTTAGSTYTLKAQGSDSGLVGCTLTWPSDSTCQVTGNTCPHVGDCL